jgi:hypothetical protein
MTLDLRRDTSSGEFDGQHSAPPPAPAGLMARVGSARFALRLNLLLAVAVLVAVLASWPASPRLQTLPSIDPPPVPGFAAPDVVAADVGTPPDVASRDSGSADVVEVERRQETLPPVPPAASWMAGTRRDPVTWPCGPIPLRVVTAGAPDGAVTFVRRAAGLISEASGRRITFSHKDPVATWRGHESRGGIIVGWPPPRVASWGPGQAGIGGNAYLGDTYVRGHAWLHPTRQVLSFGGSYGSAGAVLLHEMSHALGLGHAEPTADSLMTPTVTRVSFTESDLAQLRYLGAVACS